MTALFFIFVPLGWGLVGHLLGRAVAVSVPTPAGERLGQQLACWGRLALPLACVALFAVGLEGDAGHGVFLFGSANGLEWAFVSWYLAAGLGAYLLLAHVGRDAARGVRHLRGPK